ncbi:Plasmodium exported protein, unknown function [Plasmodium chabaudi chabaudi]|uniref:Uncharacterized protein n=1 Tax=Plasmodium chabaudi chabaudi TaxID=31271 RepID=A0A4V0K3J8_PLACU|nr:Plasmodium exported protein, unknown function [Plasmodium chabaudi chabaudi]VTZ66909.1 Plasmodium exported protein, unknown function [Plasmodium chabaudi chabaudi]|eukprot:XP_016653119.1 Plasmodium exported protein, unknown function [Plasmodium chabaudi chabaudi]
MANIRHPMPKHAINYSYGKNESNKNFTKKYVYIPLPVAYLIKLCKTTTIKILSIINMLYLCIFLIWTTSNFNYNENYYGKQKNFDSTVYNRLLSDVNLLALEDGPVTNSIIDNRNIDNENLLLVPFLKTSRSSSRWSDLKGRLNESINVTQGNPPNRDLTKSPNRDLNEPPKGFIRVPQRRDLNGYTKLNKNENTELIPNIPKEILQKAPPNTRIYIRKLPPSQLRPHLSGNVPGDLKSTSHSNADLDGSMKREIPPTDPSNSSIIKSEANMLQGNNDDKENNSMPNNNSEDGTLLKMVKGVEHYTKSITDSIRNNLSGVEFKENCALNIIEKNVASGVKIANTSVKKGMDVLKENATETLKAIDTDVKPRINNLKDSIMHNVEAVKSGEKTISDIKDSVIDTINNNIENNVKPKTEQIKNDVTHKIDNISTQLKTQVGDIKDNIKEGVHTIGAEIIPQIGHSIKDTVEDTIEDITTGIEKSSDVVKEKVIESICKNDKVPEPIKEIVMMAADENITSMVAQNIKEGKPISGIKGFFKKNVRLIKLGLSLGLSGLLALGAIINLILGSAAVSAALFGLALVCLYYFIYEMWLKETRFFRWIRSVRKKKN